MWDAEKSFDEVRQWSDISKQDFIPVRNLRDRLKEALSEFKNRKYKRERTRTCFRSKKGQTGND